MLKTPSLMMAVIVLTISYTLYAFGVAHSFHLILRNL